MIHVKQLARHICVSEIETLIHLMFSTIKIYNIKLNQDFHNKKLSIFDQTQN